VKIGIIGAGVAGLTAAYELSKRGCKVIVFEAKPQAGGLASGFRDEGWEWPLERFYHHWFASDGAVLGLIDELGLGGRVFFPRPITSIWHKGAAYPFDSPLAVLRFPYLSLPHKLRFGLVTLYLRLARNWRPMENTTAHQWLSKAIGKRAYEVVWEPLLAGKFGDDYRKVNMAWFWARIKKRSPRLGYFVGGFQAFIDALAERVREQGGEVHLSTPVQRIVVEGGRVVGVRITSSSKQQEASDQLPASSFQQLDKVIATVSPQMLIELTPDLPKSYVSRLRRLQSLGAVVLILALDRPLTDGHYWINLPRGEFPFLVLVEHTNYIAPEHYGGDHLVYLGHYPPPSHPYFQMSKEELLKLFLPSLKRFNPAFNPSWVRDSWLFREPYAQPVPMPNHSQLIPDLVTPIRGLFWASMSQVYPWDRGTNYAVELGRKVASLAMSLHFKT